MPLVEKARVYLQEFQKEVLAKKDNNDPSNLPTTLLNRCRVKVAGQASIIGELKTAEEVAEKITDQNEKDTTYHVMLWRHALLEDTETILRLLPSMYRQDYPVFQHRVLDISLKAGDLKTARRAADMIKEPGYRVEALCRVALAHIKAGHGDRGRNLLKEVAKLAFKVSWKEDKIGAHIAVAKATWKAGDLNDARRILEKLREAVRSVDREADP